MPMMKSRGLCASAIVLALVSLCAGCGPVFPYVPLQAPDKDETYYSFHAAVPFSKFTRVSLQFSFSHALGDNKVLGCTFYKFLLPSAVSYGQYIGHEYTKDCIQMHLDLSGHGPMYEIDYVFIDSRDRMMSAFKAGAGFSWTGIVPCIELSMQERNFRMNIGHSFGRTKAAVKDLAKQYRYREEPCFEYNASDIDTIIPDTNVIQDRYSIRFRNGKRLLLDDGYFDAPLSSQKIWDLNKYAASDSSRFYYVYFWGLGPPGIKLLQLNVPAIMKRMRNSGVLIIDEERDAMAKSLSKINPWIEDLYIEIGYENQE
jgi:hypothetical protein